MVLFTMPTMTTRSPASISMTLLSPTLYKYASMYNTDAGEIEDHIDFWHDSLNDCYANDMSIHMICTYIDAITDEYSE